MKKFYINSLFLMVISLYSTTSIHAATPVQITNEQGDFMDNAYEPTGLIVTAPINGQILYEYNKDERWPIASMSKLMTLYLVYEAMNEGKFNEQSKVKVNDKFYNISRLPMLSNNTMRIGAEYTVEELIDLAILPSSNAATYMLASMVDKDDSAFIDKMNTTAKKLGMNHTKFYNPAGPPNNLLLNFKAKRYQENEDNESTAKDYAILADRLINQYPQLLKHTKQVSVVIKPGTIDEEVFNTYNYSLEGARLGYKGVDGLKTGSSDTAGFNTTLTAKQQDLRINLVLLGVKDWFDEASELNRNIIANNILDYVFERYEYKKLLQKGRHTIHGKDIYVYQDLYDVVKKGTKGNFTLNDGILTYNYDRQFIKNDNVQASVPYEDYSSYSMKKFIKDNKTSLITISICIVLGVALFIYYMLQQEIKRKPRRNKRK